jgi:hypothetical protein
MALAMAVRAGFTAPMLGNKLVSTTYQVSGDMYFPSTKSAPGLQLSVSVIVFGHEPIVEAPGLRVITRWR